MTCIVFFVLAFLSLAWAQNDMGIFKLTNEIDAGVKCLDGSPVAYYLRRNESNTNWVIFFQGGGWCNNLQQCYERSLSTLGSSTTYPATMTSSGILSNSAEINPDFYQWNAVYLPYCDGASWMGANTNIVYYDGHPLFFRGKLNLDAVMIYLSRAGMLSATSILVSGCSAGGLATYEHADFIAQLFPSATVKAAAVSGYFLYIENFQGVRIYTEEMDTVYEMQNTTSGMHQNCLIANNQHPNYCMFAPFVYPHIQVPFFILNSLYDEFQLTCILAANSSTGACSADPSWAPCLSAPDKCTADEVTFLNTNFRSVMLNLMTSSPNWNSPKNGAFLDSCMAHCETMAVSGPGIADWSHIEINGIDATHAVGDWFFERTTNNHIIDCEYTTTAPVACNPTCGQGQN